MLLANAPCQGRSIVGNSENVALLSFRSATITYSTKGSADKVVSATTA